MIFWNNIRFTWQIRYIFSFYEYKLTMSTVNRAIHLMECSVLRNTGCPKIKGHIVVSDKNE